MSEILLPSWRDRAADRASSASSTGLAGSRRMCLLVDHDDPIRDYSYASEAGSFATDESILDTGLRSGWTLASIEDHRSTVFAPS